MRRRPALGASVVVSVGAGYAWWATGLASFTAWGYLAVAIPAVALVIAAVIGPRVSRAVPRRPVQLAIVPWVVLAAAAVALEATGLALGGRSPTVPTLSDVIDRLIAPHPVRALAFLGWLAVGIIALRAATRRDAGGH